MLDELTGHLRRNGERLRLEWVERIMQEKLLAPMTEAEIRAECRTLYESCLTVLESGRIETLETYAQNLSERVIRRGVEAYDVLSVLPILRDVFVRELIDSYGTDPSRLKQILDAYGPAANRIVPTLGVIFIRERERIIRQQQDVIRELSTPVLAVRERLLILPIIGAIDPQRARQLTQQLLVGIRANRAEVVVMDVTGVAGINATVANHLVQTVDAAGLLGATVIVTGLSAESAQALVNLGVNLAKMNTAGDLRGGIEEAERLLGYTLVTAARAHAEHNGRGGSVGRVRRGSPDAASLEAQEPGFTRTTHATEEEGSC